MKRKISIIACLIVFLTFTNIGSYAQYSRTISSAAKKIAPKVFKAFVKNTIRGAAFDYLISSKNATIIEGGFYYFYDDYGNPFVVFAGTNTSSNSVVITFSAVNEYTSEQRSDSIILSEGECFYFGLPHGWRWLRGEKMIIKYSNGDRVYWEYN
jgi:hypothetical protein